MIENIEEVREQLRKNFMNRAKQDFIGSVLFTLTFFSYEDIISFVDLAIKQNSKDHA